LRAGLNFDVIADPARESGLRFNVRVLDEAGFVLAFGGDFPLGQCAIYVSAYDASAHQHVLFAVGVNTRRTLRKSCIDRLNRGQFFPSNGKRGWIKINNRRSLTAGDGSPR
jgi:hypothetical protein